MTTNILVVDDSHVDRLLAGSLLRSIPGYHIELSGNGKDALERMAIAPPEIVVTDLVMPGMNGLELVKAVRQRHPHIPVVVMTAYGNEELAVESLEAGAASYVPKVQQAERLTETVARVIARAEAEKARHQLNSCLTELYCSYSLDNDPALISALVDQVQQTLVGIQLGDSTERIRVCVALEEALLNAMFHGNLEIGREELAESRVTFGRTTLETLLAQRRARSRFQSRRVVLDAHISTEGARFVVRDEGRGFNTASAENRIGDFFERGQNRGLMLMRSLMDEVSFNDCGNTVTMVKLRMSHP